MAQKAHPSILKLKESEFGQCPICVESKNLEWIDKELQMENCDGKFCGDCLMFVRTADYALNKEPGYCRPQR